MTGGADLLLPMASSTRQETARTLKFLTVSEGGDSFASGLIYGFLSGQEPQWSVGKCGAAHGALW